MAKNKRAKRIAKLAIQQRPYSLEELLGLLAQYKTECSVKFDETVEIACRLGVDPKHSDQMVRGTVALPSGTGKDVRVAVFTSQDRVEEFRKLSGADIVGSDELVDKIQKGAVIDFDKCVATPDYMPTLAKIGKILGPRGLMPNPKLGTVTNDVKIVAELKAGKVEFKTDKSGIVHAGIGKMSFDAKALKSNITAFVKAIQDAKPSAAKGEFFRSVFISTTMGPAIELDIGQIIA